MCALQQIWDGWEGEEWPREDTNSMMEKISNKNQMWLVCSPTLAFYCVQCNMCFRIFRGLVSWSPCIVALVCSEHWTLTSWVWTWIESERISERRKKTSAIELLKSKPIIIWNGQTLRAAEVQTMLLTHRQGRSLNDQWLHKTHGKGSGQPR